MRNNIFNQLATIINIKIEEIQDYFTYYLFLAEKKIKEIKSKSHGAYEIKQCVDEFFEILNSKSSELIDVITKLAINSGRSFSKKQYIKIIKKCSACLESIIKRFSQILIRESEFTESNKNFLIEQKEKVLYKVEKNVLVIKIFLSKKIDKALRWTVVGVITSTLLSIIAIIISIVK